MLYILKCYVLRLKLRLPLLKVSITMLYLMAKVFTSIYRHLQLFTADKILLANKSTPGLKQSIHENKALLSVAKSKEAKVNRK